MTAKAALLFLVLSAIAASAAPAPNPTAPERGHVVAPTADASGAVTRARFEARIEDMASRAMVRLPGVKADRYAEFDIAWPHDAQEWDDLHGNAVLLTGALAQDGSELPLARLYLLHADGNQVALRRIGAAVRLLPAGSNSSAVFGPNLSEEFYLLPVAALDAQTQLLGDFAKSRLGFVLADDLAPPARFVGAPASPAPPPLSAVKILVDREYPDFGIRLEEPGP